MTRRQAMVAEMFRCGLVLGESDRQIAARIGIKPGTLGVYKTQLRLRRPSKGVAFRDCISCGKPGKTLRCGACDRRHHRSGSCPCGWAIELTASACPRCGAERVAARTGGLPMPVGHVVAWGRWHRIPLRLIAERLGVSEGTAVRLAAGTLREPLPPRSKHDRLCRGWQLRAQKAAHAIEWYLRQPGIGICTIRDRTATSIAVIRQLCRDARLPVYQLERARALRRRNRSLGSAA